MPAVKKKTRGTAPATDSNVLTPTNPPGLRDLPFALPSVTAAEKRRARTILKALRDRYPDAKCALHYNSPHELLVATILSAQTTDVNVNKATPALFEKFPTPADYAKASAAKIEPYVRTLGFFRNKARAIYESMRDVAELHDGQVPRTMDELLALRGVARKTANVVLGNAYHINVGFVVDTHIERISKRFGLAPDAATVSAVERRLCALFPREAWGDLSHLIIAHGRAACKARSGSCSTDAICKRFCSNAKKVNSRPSSARKNTRAKKTVSKR